MNVTKGTGRGLTPELIASSALRIIEEQGLSALSARKVAAALGCEAMSLYHHFANMNALLDAVVDTLLAGLGTDRGSAQSTPSVLMEQAMAYLTIAEQNPHAFQLVATRRWRTPNALAAARSMVSAFVSLGYSADHSLRQTRILAAYLNGAGMALAAWRKSDGQIGDEVATALRDVTASHFEAHTVRTDLLLGLELLVAELMSNQEPAAPA
jgi:AcrR family transcriptional regulator